ncbi:MAG TPA: sigma-54 dependent transcriptional regulator [Vicinamibacterales bacterium]|nr:sigma-54 dependent transcriptional regulator [Vicinamibacterales bacterium]
MPGSILLADDEEKILKTLGRALRDDGHEVVTASNARDATRLLSERSFDLLVIDFLMPDRTGLDVIRDLAASAPEGERPAVVMMTAHGSIESAVEAMKLGARDYLQKPFEVDELLVLARRALEDQRARTGLRYLLSERDAEFDHYGIIGRSRAILDVIARAELVAESKSTVLVTGETGTGKELVARAIHARSAQRSMPLIKVNCAAIPETLLESELFGHVRGAFTGATFTKKGRFSLADGGTIFLDEIGTVSLSVQAKLLRVLQDREFEPLGAERTQKVDVRVIAATNRDLRQLVAEGRFLEDLFYRLNVIPIEMPALRERREDIPLLVQHFVRRFAERTGKKIEGVDDKAMIELQRYEWPGNVRELENTMERAVVLSTAPLLDSRTVWLMSATSTPATAAVPSLKLHQNLEWAERETMRRALEQARGVKKDAAELMGISQRALSHYLAKYRIES